MKIIFFISLFLLLSTLSLSATIINVPADQPTIQAGIDAAVDTDTVLVAEGTYFENIDFIGKAITVASNFLIDADTLHIANTIINGSQPTNPDYGSCARFMSGEDTTSVIIGFTLTEGTGYPTESWNIKIGGGIYCIGSSPKIISNIITGNSATRGGGIYCNNSNPSLNNVTITDNSATGSEMPGGYGGGITCVGSSPSLQNVTITENSAYNGGGIWCGSSSPSLLNVTITGNFAGNHGGGIYYHNSSPSLVNVIISGNSATEYFGGRGGGIYCWDSSPTLTNVTITGNFASALVGGFGSGGGIYCCENSNPSLTNCILCNDTPEEVYFGEYGDPNSITISYSDIQGGEAGIVTNNNGIVNWLEGNINEDLLFDGTGGYPFSLLEDSPCIDAGNPDPIYYDPEDPTNPGYALYPAMGTVINDMGAYGGPNVIGWPVVGLDDNVIAQTPEVFLHQNYPNPFNPTTTISFSLTTELTEHTELIIYNMRGQRVKQLVSDQLSAGQHSVVWDGKDDNYKPVSSGIYFYKLKTKENTQIRKMVLIK
jgi:flagellar hook capping protein FlgD/polymorphic membrane protein